MPTIPATALAARRRLVACLVLVTGLVIGCEQAEQVSTYTVPTHESEQTPEYLAALKKRQAVPARMLAAIVPHGSEFWFFKLQGPPDAVAACEVEFRALLTSVQFSAVGKPEWTLPADWQEKPGNELRFRTLIPAGKHPLEVSVSMLPAGPDRTEGLLANINRWRNQLDLPHIEAEDIPSRTETLEANGNSITLLKISGKARPAAAMPPMAMGPGAPKGPAEQKGPVREPSAFGEIQFAKPAEWLAVAPKRFIQAAFTVVDGKKELNITLSRAGGSKIANVNRWRGQMGLEPLDESELAKSLQKFPLAMHTAELIEMKSETQSLVVVMIEDGDQTVFAKLMGDPELAVRERTRFEEFAQSLKF